MKFNYDDLNCFLILRQTKLTMKIALKQLPILAFSLFIGVAGLSSCKKEGCTDAIATNYDEDADEDDGTCEYVSDKFVGTYIMSETVTPPTGDPYSINYTLTIERDASNGADVRLKRLSDFSSADVLGVVSATGTTINITNGQVISGSNTFEINGSLSLSNGTLTSVYTVKNDGTTDNVSGTGIKQ